MKRSLLLETRRESALVVAGTCLIAGTYGLVRLAYGLFLPDIRDSLSMSSAAAGYVSTGASFAYCVGAVFGLAAARRSRLLVAAALTTASLGAVGMALAPNLAVFVPWAVLSSTGAGLASPALVAVVERNLPARRVDRAQATVNSGTGPGLVAAGLLALVLLPQWRLGFAVGAVLTAVAGAGVLLLDRDDDAVGEPAAHDDGRRGVAWWPVLRVPAVGAFLLGTASAAVWTYGRTQLVEQGTGGAASTVAWMALGVGGAVAVLTTRPLSRTHPARAWLLTTAGVSVATAVLAVAADRLPWALAACALFGWGFVAASSALIVWTTLLVPRQAAAGTALLFITIVLGQAVGSALAGSVAERSSLSSALLLAAALAAVAASVGLRSGSRAAVGP